MNSSSLNTDLRTFLTISILTTHPDGAATAYKVLSQIRSLMTTLLASQKGLSPGAFYSHIKKMINNNLVSVININQDEAPSSSPGVLSDSSLLTASRAGGAFYSNNIDTLLHYLINSNHAEALTGLVSIKEYDNNLDLTPTIKRLKLELIKINHTTEATIAHTKESGAKLSADLLIRLSRIKALISECQVLST